MRSRRLLIAGCGRLGAALAAQLPDFEVHGLRRDSERLPPGVRPVRADLASGAGLQDLPAGLDAVVYAATPVRRDESGYREIYVDGLHRLLAALPQPAPSLRLLFVSSTAVHGEDAGEEVDEGSEAAPATWNGRALLAAERAAAATVADCVILRLAGLYGPGSEWLARRVRAGEAIAPGVHWSNRIHVEDAAALAALLLRLPRAPACVIGVDDEPAPERAVLDWIAARIGSPPVPAGAGALIGGKRLRNHLARSLGWRPRYPSFRDGYTSLLPGNPP